MVSSGNNIVVALLNTDFNQSNLNLHLACSI